MSVAAVLGIGVLGGVGALARALLDGAVARRLGHDFPFGTLAVNLSGALALGALSTVALGAGGDRLAGTGFLGAFTTFSTWALDSHRLAEDGRARLGALNVGLSLAGGLAAAWLGRELGGHL